MELQTTPQAGNLETNINCVYFTENIRKRFIMQIIRIYLGPLQSEHVLVTSFNTED